MSNDIRKKAQVHLFHLSPSGQPEFILLRRWPDRGAVWQCVTGKAEQDEDVDDCARRETREETSLPLGERAWNDIWSYKFYKGSRQFEEHVYCFEAADRNVVLSSEHDTYCWLPAEQALTMIHFEGVREGLRRVLAAMAESLEK